MNSVNTFKTIFELSPDPILIIKDDNFIDCNQAAITIMGANSKEELIKIDPSKISPKKQPDGQASINKAKNKVENAYKDGVARFEWLHTKIDGSDLFVEVTLTKFNIDDNELLHVHWKDISDKKEIENQLEYMRERLSEIAEISSDWIWEVDKNGIYTFVGTKVMEFLGYEAKDIIGNTPFKLMSEAEAKRVGDIFLEYISKQLPFKDLENVNIHKDGHEVTLQTSGTPIFNIHGEFVGYIGTHRDISNIKKLIKNLTQHQENLNQAQRLSNIGHWELDLITNELYWSDEVYRIFGLTPQEFGATYEAFLQYVHPDDHKLVNDSYSKSIEDISSYEIRHRVVTKQGNIKFVEERCNHEIDLNGKAIRSIGTVHDITQRVKYEKELQLASNVFKYSSDAIIITDANNKIVTLNKAFENLTGYSLHEVKGKNPKVLSSGWGDRDFYNQMWDDINSKGIWVGEIWDRKKCGEIYAASESIIVVKDDNNNVINYIGISHDITQSKENEKKITQLAYYDFLTKLPNRKLFQQEVESFIKSSHFNDKKFAILFLDLDNFKWVNDSLGHLFGDKILIHVSKLISAIISEDSIFARLGGDEFIILIPYDNLLNISQLAVKIIDTVKYPITLDNAEVNVGWSIGVSLFPDNAITYDTLLQNADTAMYQAKDSGKNNFKYFNEDMNKIAKRRLELDTRLRHAVENNEFSLVYQPKVSCKEKRILGFEALIRWTDHKLGSVTPDEFIPVAEQSGYIYDIGLWVLEKAFNDLNIIDKMYSDTKYKMAINISGKQLEDKRFLHDVKQLIKTTKVDIKTLEFEITETALMNNIQNVIPVLNELKNIGIRLSIDDFGTGYSSLVYLKKMPIDTLKIDREFISEIEKNDEDKAIVEATIALAKALKLDTVAEGVETIEQSNILKNMNCSIFQGYLYSKPLKINDLFKFIDGSDKTS